MESANQRPSHRRLGREADRNRPLSLLRERGLGESLLASAQHSEISGTAADAGATPGSTRRKVILEPPSSDRTFALRRLALHQCTLRALTRWGIRAGRERRLAIRSRRAHKAIIIIAAEGRIQPVRHSTRYL